MIDHQKQTAILLKLIADSRVKTFQLTLLGDSMLPLLTPGTQAQFQKIRPGRLPKISDVAAVKFKNNLLVHRIISIRGRGPKREYLTKGDRLPKADGWAGIDKIAGIMIQPAALQSAVYYPQILKLKTAFEAAKINFVFLKGLPLYLYFTKSNPQRALADCDVLIDKKDKSPVDKIFRRQGYRLAETAYSKFHQRLKDKLTEITYFKVVNNCPVAFDVHFEAVFLMDQMGKLDALYSQKLIDEMSRQFLKEKQKVKIRGQNFSILSPANLIIYLGLHFFHHNFTGRHRLEFWHKVIGYYQKQLTVGLDKEIISKISSYQLQNFVYPGFALVNKSFGEVLPPKFMAETEPGKKVLKYIDKKIKMANINRAENRPIAGVDRFKNIFYLSPSPWYRKILVFFNPAVIYSAIWTMIKRLLPRP